MAYGRSISVDDRRYDPRQKKRGSIWLTALLVLGAIGLLTMLLLPTVRTARHAARRAQCENNLKRIALALLNYHDDYHSLPPAYTVDAQGKPLHSWRTLILPYLGQRELYESIDLTKPWDDPANASALESRVLDYECAEAIEPRNRTTYFACVTPAGAFRGAEPVSTSDLNQNAANTPMLVEVPVDRAVPWMQPRDADESLVFAIGPDSKLNHGVIITVFVDGSLRSLPSDLSEDDRRKLLASQPISY